MTGLLLFGYDLSSASTSEIGKPEKVAKKREKLFFNMLEKLAENVKYSV